MQKNHQSALRLENTDSNSSPLLESRRHCLIVTPRIDRLLESEGIATLMTRLGDTYVSLADRAAFANRITNCIFVSIHFNEDNKPVASGVETYYASHQIATASSVASWLRFLWRPLSESPNPESQKLAV